MMFPWNIARSAEAVFSRWAVKRVCKFLLKKKLGQFILGEIDIDQLDVQLSDGTIQLSDLALNVDYLNEKVGAAASLIIKEGSIGSLLVRMPWKGKGCQVEVDELEVVLASSLKSNLSSGNEACSTSQDGTHTMHHGMGKPGHDVLDGPSKSTSTDVHEGVKTIAKMVKLFLTSFHVKIKKLIVAFDPRLEKDEKEVATCTTLVLRILETECGICVSEDSNSNGNSEIESFLGISRLMNFVKFQGAILELVQMDNVDGKTSLDEQFTGCCPSNATTPIITGKEGGISGSLRLSIPWKDGSLDIRRVDADVYIDPLELRFQPITIKWFLLSWEAFKNLASDGRAHISCKTADSVYVNSTSHFHSPIPASAVIPIDKDVHIRGSISSNLHVSNSEESVTGPTLPGSHLIHDWVPYSVSNYQKLGAEDDDFGASVDQFFECFDGMRNYQSALGSSGMWNWTSSVFTAITAASSLASGSLHVPSEQQHIQTNLKATFSGISVVLSFHDDGNKIHDVMDAHYLGAECKGIFVAMQVRPWEMSLEGTMKYIEVAHYLFTENDVMNFEFRESNSDIKGETYLIKNLQAEVEDTLPPFPSSTGDPELDKLSGVISDAFLSGNKGSAVKTLLLRSSGVTQCQVTVNSQSSDGSLRQLTLFSLNLPPFIFWLNLHLVNMLLNLFKEVGESVERSNKKNGFLDQGCCEKCDPFQGDEHLQIRTLSSTDSFRGNISIPTARFILCFPFEGGKEIGGSFSWAQFIALDFASSKTLEKEKIQGRSPILDGFAQGRTFSSSAMRSLHFCVGNLSVYLVTSACEVDIGNNSSSSLRKLSAHKVLSVSNESACLSIISMSWQAGPVTGPWMAEKAKFLATSEDSRNRNKVNGKGYEFATVTAIKDLEDIYSQTREEILLSSSFFLHVHMFPVRIHLHSSHYTKLLSLIDHVKCGLSSTAYEESSGRKEYYVNQASILLECDSVEILVRPETKEHINAPLQSELPGSWHCLKLIVQKFDLLLVSNIGGIYGADFFWLAHGEGKLWGSVTGVWDKEFLLISCSSSTIKRGDGGGSNALSSRLAGSDIVHLWEPETSRGYTSITLRCSTIVAVGGRLDWLESIASFFSIPSPETDQAVDKDQQEGYSDARHGTFVLNFVDIGLSYEPHFKSLMVHSEVLESEATPVNVKEESSLEAYVGCLLAASSLTFSNITVEDSRNDDYRIRVQDLGLLLCTVSDSERLGDTYSVEYLCETGYAKVAREALAEAILRTNCENGLLWEVECFKSHIYVETCNDTTSGLIRLGDQLQKLFATDVEESIVHLQTRWNNVQQEKERNDSNDKAGIFNGDLASQMQNSSSAKRASGDVGLMDEISENVFHLDGSQTCQFNSSDSQLHTSQDGIFLGEACNLSFDTPEIISHDLSVKGSALAIGLESSQTSFLENDYSPELIESYCLSELRPLSELSAGREMSGRHRNLADGDLERRSTGWYGDASLRIVENHISETVDLNGMIQVQECMPSSVEGARPDDFRNPLGRVLLKNINVIWRMYAGSDWHSSRKDNESFTIYGRDTTVCLELELSGLQCQYDLFPVGGICSSKLSLSVQDFLLYDRSKVAPWQLVLGYYNSKDHPRESSSKAFKLDLEAVRPDPLIQLEEYRLRVAFLPMLLHLHQSQLDFLISFFGPKSLAVNQTSGCPQDSSASKLVLTESGDPTGHNTIEEALLPYFQKFDIWPLLVRVDYSPRHVDLAALGAGKYVELVNLIPWKGVELQLKHVHAAGVYGWGNVCETIIGEWLEDISQNQIQKILRGIPTIRSLFAVGDGAAKLVSLPVASYRKDQRVLKGLQRGTIAFLRSISLEAVGLGVHLAAGFHDLLLKAEYVLTSIPPSLSLPSATTKSNVRYNQPRDAQEGIRQAYESLSNGLGKSASALVQTPLKRYQRGASAGSAFATAVQAVPGAAIVPASACASAIHCAFLGFRNSLDPERKKESMEKYLGPNQPRNQS